jgi:hypothetical protein
MSEITQAVGAPLERQVGPLWADAPLALFAGPTYYPSPGFRNHVAQFAALEEACAKGRQIAEDEYGWWQVVDLMTLKIVAGEGAGHSGLFGKVAAA